MREREGGRGREGGREVLYSEVRQILFLPRYKYNVCPFHNVTQKEERTTWNSFHGVLG